MTTRMSSGAAGSVAGELRAAALQFQRAAPGAALAQIGTTLLPLLSMIAVMYAGLARGWWWLTPALALPAAALTVRAFIIQHDCGRASSLPSRAANDAVGGSARC